MALASMNTVLIIIIKPLTLGRRLVERKTWSYPGAIHLGGSRDHEHFRRRGPRRFAAMLTPLAGGRVSRRPATAKRIRVEPLLATLKERDRG